MKTFTDVRIVSGWVLINYLDCYSDMGKIGVVIRSRPGSTYAFDTCYTHNVEFVPASDEDIVHVAERLYAERKVPAARLEAAKDFAHRHVSPHEHRATLSRLTHWLEDLEIAQGVNRSTIRPQLSQGDYERAKAAVRATLNMRTMNANQLPLAALPPV